MRSVIRIGSLTLFLILTLSAHPILAAQSTIEAVLYEDTAVHHLGDQVLGDWEIPEPEGIAYEATFSLDTSSNIILALDVFNVHQDTPIKLNNAQIDFLCAQGGYDEWNSCHYNIDSSFTMEGENYLTIELQYFEGLDDHYDDIMIRNVRLFLCPGTAEFFDADGDGWAGCDGHVDCDDSDSDINPEMGVYPGAPELCDGLDTDCDGILPDDEFDDADGDGYMICEGDCDDTDPDVSPDAVEGAIEDPSCSDGIDNDCDGLIDTDPECISFLVPDEQSTIQDAINAAESGNTILVDPGIYRENIDFMGKSITVHSVDGPVTTIIDGDRSGSVVTFSSGETEDAVLGGFTIKNGSGTYNVLVPHLGFGRYVGGGLYLENSSPTITNCMITNNYAFIGGGLYLRASTPMITNSMIVRNRATGFIHGGGGIFLEDSNPTVTHCTVGSNSAVQYGGAIYCYDASPRITNSILWGNSAIYGSEIHVKSGSPVVTYSDVEGGWSGEGNIEADPSFAGAVTFHLMPGSPCLDSGTDAGVYTDMDGQRRPWGAGFDMGADEYSTEPCSVIASSGGQFFTLYLIPVLAFVFLSRKRMIKK